MGRQDRIEIAEYDEDWPERFDHLREHLEELLAGLAVRIEHVGSTAVPGLPAKPIIDLDIVASDLLALRRVIERLEDAGYDHEGELGVPGRHALRPPSSTGDYHPYVVVEGSTAHRAHVTFRDHLRADPDLAAEYAAVKRRAASEHFTERGAYTAAKSEFIERVLPS